MREAGYLMNRMVPILRIFDIEKAKEFYLDFLGFQLNWEHRFEGDLPLYMEVSHGNCSIHLSEHYGDGTPGTSIRVELNGLEVYHQELVKKEYPYARPGIEKTPWNTIEMTLNDPFGNRIVFYEEKIQ
jgi:catechol 2,3-dioxygenase-like lactoylglutathione lyase family enzyme